MDDEVDPLTFLVIGGIVLCLIGKALGAYKNNSVKTRLQKRLRVLGTDLKAIDLYREQAERLTEKIVVKLQTHLKRFPVVKPLCAGSFGKGTDVLEPDIDLIVVLNNVGKPPFEEPLKECERILKENQSELLIEKGSVIRKTKYSIQLRFVNGIDVDLLVGANMKPNQIYQLLRRNPEKFYEYGSSLAATQVQFMRSQGECVHKLIRLTKFWFKSLHFGHKWVSGGCTIMELLCTAASARCDNFHDFSLAFREVLDMIIQMNTLKICFEQIPNNPGKWRYISPHELERRAVQSIVPRVIGTPEIWSRSCYIVEPANPFNDLLAGQDEEVVWKLRNFAYVTRGRLNEILQSDEYDKTDAEIVNIIKLFGPQPLDLLSQFPTGLPDEVRICCEETPFVYPNCHKRIRNDIPLKRKDVQAAVETIRKRLLFMINATIHNDPANITNQTVLYEVKNFISTNLKIEGRKIVANLHEEMDVTLCIPYRINNVAWEIHCSMKWNPIPKRRRRSGNHVIDIENM